MTTPSHGSSHSKLPSLSLDCSPGVSPKLSTTGPYSGASQVWFRSSPPPLFRPTAPLPPSRSNCLSIPSRADASNAALLCSSQHLSRTKSAEGRSCGCRDRHASTSSLASFGTVSSHPAPVAASCSYFCTTPGAVLPRRSASWAACLASPAHLMQLSMQKSHSSPRCGTDWVGPGVEWSPSLAAEREDSSAPAHPAVASTVFPHLSVSATPSGSGSYGACQPCGARNPGKCTSAGAKAGRPLRSSYRVSPRANTSPDRPYMVEPGTAYELSDVPGPATTLDEDSPIDPRVDPAPLPAAFCVYALPLAARSPIDPYPSSSCGCARRTASTSAEGNIDSGGRYRRSV